MSPLKSAYELASERIISSPNSRIKEEHNPKPKIDFVEIPEFSNKEDVVLESKETELITETAQHCGDLTATEDPEEISGIIICVFV